MISAIHKNKFHTYDKEQIKKVQPANKWWRLEGCGVWHELYHMHYTAQGTHKICQIFLLNQPGDHLLGQGVPAGRFRETSPAHWASLEGGQAGLTQEVATVALEK